MKGTISFTSKPHARDRPRRFSLTPEIWISAYGFKNVLHENRECLALSIILLFGILSVRTLLMPGMPVTWDHPVHIANAWNLAVYFFPRGELFGYDPFNALGWVFAEYPFAYAIVAFAYYALGSGFAQFVTAYKIVIALSYLLPIVALYVLMRSLQFDSETCLAAAFFQSITFPNETWATGLYSQAIYGGLFANALAVSFVFIALALFSYALRRQKADWIITALSTGLFAGLSFLTHPTTATIFLILIPLQSIFFLLEKRSWNSIRRVIYVVTVGSSTAINTSAIFLLPYLSYLKDYHPFSIISSTWNWSVAQSLRNVSGGMVFFPILVMGIVGFFSCLHSKKTSQVFLSYSAAVCLTVGMGFSILYPIMSSIPVLDLEDFLFLVQVRTLVLFPRFFLLLHLFVCGLAGVGFSLIRGKLVGFNRLRVGRFLIKQRVMSLQSVFAFFIILLCISSQFQSTDLGYGVLSDEKKILLSDDYPLFNKMSSAMRQLNDIAPINSRILVEDTFGGITEPPYKPSPSLVPRLSDSISENRTFPTASHVLALAPLFSQRVILGSLWEDNYVANRYAVTYGSRLLNWSLRNIRDKSGAIDSFASALHELGVGYILCYSPELIRFLNSHSERFVECYDDGVFHVFRVVPPSEIFEIDGIGQLTLEGLTPNRFSVRVAGSTFGSRLRVKLIYYPNWKCFVDGTERQIRVVNKLGVPFMEVDLKDGDTQIVFLFEETPIDLAGKAISIFMVTISVLVGLLVLLPRKKVATRAAV